jgi:hypothetical protein
MACIRFVFIALLYTLLFAGCSGEVTEAVTPTPPPPLKTTLEGVAASGQPIGSLGMELQTQIEELRATDPTKADELKKDLDELRSMHNSQQIKSKASAMAKKL